MALVFSIRPTASGLPAGFEPMALEALVAAGVPGCVLECYGSGTAPLRIGASSLLSNWRVLEIWLSLRSANVPRARWRRSGLSGRGDGLRYFAWGCFNILVGRGVDLAAGKRGLPSRSSRGT